MRLRFSILTLAALVLVGLQGPAAAAASGRLALPSPVPSWIKTARDDGRAGVTVSIPFRVYLAGKSPTDELTFAVAVSTPSSESFRQYLAPRVFRRRFGPTQAQIRAVITWARHNGFTVTARTSHYIGLVGTAPAIDAALGTSIHIFGGTRATPTGYAPVRGISVPAPLGRAVLTILGLDDNTYTPPPPPPKPKPRPKPAKHPGGKAGAAPRAVPAPDCSQWWGENTATIPLAFGVTSAPTAVCGYTPDQLRSAYGVSSFSGRRATIAVVLDGHLTSMLSDANRFFAAHGVPGFSRGQYVENFGAGFAESCGTSADVPEEPLDVESAHIIAPDARVIYVAANCNTSIAGSEQDFLDAETRIVDRHLADVETDSFSTLESEYTPAMVTAWTQMMEQGTTEGIGFNFDSGDGGDDTNNQAGTPPAVTFPASDPWATAVGGTSLFVGQSGQAIGQLGWGDTIAQIDASGTRYLDTPPGVFAEGSTGGRSDLFAEPAYQQGVVPSALSTTGGTTAAHREVPDVSADADMLTGWLIGYTDKGSYKEVVEGGTSGSSPIIAGLEADAKQAAGVAIGFANPSIYLLGNTDGVVDVVSPIAQFIAVAPRDDCYNDKQPVGNCLVSLGLDSSLKVAAGFDEVTGVGAATDQFISQIAAL